MLAPPWISFLFVIAVVLVLSKLDVGIILFFSTILFALLTEVSPVSSLIDTISNLSVLCLAICVTLIPILGGIMEKSGAIFQFLYNIKVPRRVAYMLTPALFGLLPVPGGALLSAPVINQLDITLDVREKVGINIWYRHVLILIYPLSTALIVGTQIAGISLYAVIIRLLIPFVFMNLFGYLLFIRKIPTKSSDSNSRNLGLAFKNLVPLLIAPVINMVGIYIIKAVIPEFFLMIGLVISIVTAILINQFPLKQVLMVTIHGKIWRYFILIISMYYFLEVFLDSGVPEQLATVHLPFILFLIIGFGFAFGIGRSQLPLAILVPIYLVQSGLYVMPILDFILLYFATFLGYIITPLHPCLNLTLRFYNSNYKKNFLTLAKPVGCSLLVLVGGVVLRFILHFL